MGFMGIGLDLILFFIFIASCGCIFGLYLRKRKARKLRELLS
jgi:hypothetical protein